MKPALAWWAPLRWLVAWAVAALIGTGLIWVIGSILLVLAQDLVGVSRFLAASVVSAIVSVIVASVGSMLLGDELMGPVGRELLPPPNVGEEPFSLALLPSEMTWLRLVFSAPIVTGTLFLSCWILEFPFALSLDTPLWFVLGLAGVAASSAGAMWVLWQVRRPWIVVTPTSLRVRHTFGRTHTILGSDLKSLGVDDEGIVRIRTRQRVVAAGVYGLQVPRPLAEFARRHASDEAASEDPELSRMRGRGRE